MNFIIKYKFTLIGVVAGAVCGFLYYYFIGCSSGTCAITSRPLNSSLYGAVLGGLLFNIIKKDRTEKDENGRDIGS